MIKRHPFTLPLLGALLILLACAGCRGKQALSGSSAVKGPVAEAKQSVPAPTLAPPAPAEKPAETAVPAQPLPMVPKGPITLLPPPEGMPAAQPAAAQPLPAAQASQPGLTPFAQPPIALLPPPAAPVPPSATQPAPAILASPYAPPAAAQSPPAAETGIRALSAPFVAPAEAPKLTEAMPVAYEPRPVKAETNIEVILDASGSMSAPFGATSTTKMDLLRSAFYDIVSEMGQQQADFPRNIAVRVFGSKAPAADKNLQDTELLIGMDALNLDAIHKVLDPVKAQGMSPIALALTSASADFSAEGGADRVIILVADGADNTGGDPCAAVAKIEEGLQKTTVNTVAFDISAEDQKAIECIAQKGDGKLYFARNENELRSSLDQAINRNLPYNMKLTAQSGATPIPFDVTVFKANTKESVQHSSSFGTKLLKIAPGSYDVLIEYASSPEMIKPSKMLKGVDILATTKIGQTINFDLGELKLTVLGNEGIPTAARFDIAKTGTTETVAQIETGAEAASFFITPAPYDITAMLLESQIENFTIAEKGVEVKLGEAAERIFRFQKGTLSLKGVTTQKEAIPFVFQITKGDQPDVLIASGALSSDGGSVPLTPGNYDLLVIGADPKMIANPRTKVTGVEIKPAEATEIVATFEMGLIKLSAVDGQGGKLPAQFVIREHDTQTEIARQSSDSGEAVQIPIPPGEYDIVASSLKSILEPKPSVPVTGVSVTADKPVEQVIKFILGSLRLRGRSAKEQPIQAQFTVYRSGSDEKISSAPPSQDWMVFDLAPGVYDVLAVNVASEENPKPMIWLRDMKVEDGKTTSHEAIYTAGKLKIIGRGTNSQIITCHFRVFQYGSDRELISGETGNDWEVFEIQPGKYYLEASYHDDVQSVMLKKWINISVGENEVVEEVLRF
ncbi:MAG: VWA domain-containing protein [Pseudomonadota bacterium]